MTTLQIHVKSYLEYCATQKCLDEKTLKAYRIDLRQFFEQLPVSEVTEISSSEMETYIARLNQVYKPKTAKRKVASVKALFHYLEYKEIIGKNPFSKMMQMLIYGLFRRCWDIVPSMLPKSIHM